MKIKNVMKKVIGAGLMIGGGVAAILNKDKIKTTWNWLISKPKHSGHENKETAEPENMMDTVAEEASEEQEKCYANIRTKKYHLSSCRYCKANDGSGYWLDITDGGNGKFSEKKPGWIVIDGQEYEPCSSCKPQSMFDI